MSSTRGRKILDGFLASRYWESWSSDDNSICLSDPERYDRIISAAEYGGDGSTHGERIEDMREAWAAYSRHGRRTGSGTFPERADRAVTAELDAIERWHIDHGTIDQEVG